MSRRVVHVRIAGIVQGVGYRDWTARKAAELGLDGWVRNRVDGSVEAVLAGSNDAVARMIEALHDGPLSARVDSVDVTDSSEPVAAGFEILRTG